MANQQTVQFGILCLQTLDAHSALTAQDVSRHCGVPLVDCRNVLEAFEIAGIVAQDDSGRFHLERDISSLNAVEVLQALWYAPARVPAFRLLYSADRGSGIRKCREALTRWQTLGACPSDGGAS